MRLTLLYSITSALICSVIAILLEDEMELIHPDASRRLVRSLSTNQTFRVDTDGTRVLQRRCAIPGLGSAASASASASPSSGAVSLNSNNLLGLVKPATSLNNGCFPSPAWSLPSSNPTIPLSSWWCDSKQEYNFLGFSYDISQCPSASQMTQDLTRMRRDYKARYIRIYNSCDTTGFLDLLIQSSYNSGIGLYYTLWLGYGDQKSLVPGRLNTLKNSLQNNPIARYTIRTISCGSEGVSYAGYSQSDFINLVREVQTIASAFQIPVTASDYTWSLAVQAPAILQSLDFYEAHVLPAYDPSWAGDVGSSYNGLVYYAINTFTSNLSSQKKFVLSQAPWPSGGASSNGNGLIGSLANQQLWYNTMDSHCKDWKAMNGGGGWFYHLWSDVGSGMGTTWGYGIIDDWGNAKWPFNPTTSC